MVTLKQLDDHQQIQALKEAYLRGLVFPMDTYWQSAVVDQAAHWQIEVGGQEAGRGPARRVFAVTDAGLVNKRKRNGQN